MCTSKQLHKRCFFKKCSLSTIVQHFKSTGRAFRYTVLIDRQAECCKSLQRVSPVFDLGTIVCVIIWPLLQWTVCGQTGVFGVNATSVVVPALAPEPDRVQILLLCMMATIVMGRHKKLQRVCWKIAQVKYGLLTSSCCFTLSVRFIYGKW